MKVQSSSEPAQLALDKAASVDLNEGIRQGLADAMNGRIRPAHEFFEEFEKAHGI